MSHYTFRAHLCGLICPDCPEPLIFTKVRLYRVERDPQTVEQVAADPKETFAALTDEQVKAKSGNLIAEATTDEQGFVTFELGDEQDYDGGAFEIDIVPQTVAGLDPEEAPKDPRQYSLTTLQPRWRETEKGLVAAWDHCIHSRYWCRVRRSFGVWAICGRVVHCKTGQPIPNVRVRAFDRDWLQDDPLGSDFTDLQGRFVIYYKTSAFRQGTFIDVELIGGPDLYFRVETGAGTPLLVEPPSRGRQADRENVGPCFCVRLCLDETPQEDGEPVPVFTHVGGYHFPTQIDSAPAGSGLTVGDQRGFHNTLRLNGILSKKLNGQPMEYRFEVREIDAAGNPLGGWTAVAPGQIRRTVIGIWEHFVGGFPNPIESKVYTVNGTPGPNELVASVVGGWIRVPQESNVFGPQGFFQPNGNMIRLDSHTLAPFPDIDLTGLVTGNSSTSTGKPLAQDRHFQIRMRVRQWGLPATEQGGGVLQHIAISNTHYDNFVQHPAWMAETINNALAVYMVDIDQLTGNGCSEITNDLDVTFTAAQPHLGNVTITMSGPGGPYSFTLPAPVPGEQFGTATPNFTVGDLDPCAYIVTLRVPLLLTNGDVEPDPRFDQIAFCKA